VIFAIGKKPEIAFVIGHFILKKITMIKRNLRMLRNGFLSLHWAIGSFERQINRVESKHDSF